MRVLVTGGAGFIGSHLCRMLCKNNDVVVLDSLITGNDKNLTGLNVEFIKGDVRTPFDIRCGIIFNLASPASPADYQNYPIETLETNSFGMKNVLENARRYNALVVHASTSEVYGDPLQHPQKECYFGNVNTVGPRACYDESKRFAETLCYNYNKKFDMPVIIARIFNTYGPRMRSNDGRVMPNFITQALKNEPITVYGNGKQTRSFCYVDDMAEGLISLSKISDLQAEVFNIGNPEETDMLALASMVKKHTESDSEIVFKSLPEDDPSKRKPDISKIKKAIKWEPKIELGDGLKKTIEWFKKNLKE